MEAANRGAHEAGPRRGEAVGKLSESCWEAGGKVVRGKADMSYRKHEICAESFVERCGSWLVS